MRRQLRHKFDRVRHELVRTDLAPPARAVRLAELSLQAARISSVLTIAHEGVYELTAAPKQFRGLRDLSVRVAGPADQARLAAVAATPEALISERLARGDLAYVGELDGRMLVHAWFHRGPEPFDENVPLFPRWAIPADTFWSYHAFTVPDARASGVFVKVFQTALHDLFTVHGAARVRCLVKTANLQSVLLHERAGFRRLGTVVAFAAPGARLVSWHGEGGTRRWLQRRNGSQVLSLPPEPYALDEARPGGSSGNGAPTERR